MTDVAAAVLPFSSMSPLILVTGPSRSGKSEWAEHLAHQSGKSVIYVATAADYPDDPEWQARITQHQRRRPPSWHTRSVPVDLGEVVQAAQEEDCLLIDSLGTWLANQMELEEAQWQIQVNQLLDLLAQRRSTIILVAEETGWGVVPAYALGRTFRDRLGNLSRRIGTLADAVYLVTAGYALNLVALGTPLSSNLSCSGG